MSCSAYSSIFSHDKNGNEHDSNERREFTSIWMSDVLLLSVLYQHSPWIHTSNFTDWKWFS